MTENPKLRSYDLTDVPLGWKFYLHSTYYNHNIISGKFPWVSNPESRTNDIVIAEVVDRNVRLRDPKNGQQHPYYMFCLNAYDIDGVKLHHRKWMGKKKGYWDFKVGLAAPTVEDLKEIWTETKEFEDCFGVPVDLGDYVVYGSILVLVTGIDPEFGLVCGDYKVVNGNRVTDQQLSVYNDKIAWVPVKGISRYHDDDAMVALMR